MTSVVSDAGDIDKLLACVNILMVRCDEGLPLDPSDPSCGLIPSWSEFKSVITHPTCRALAELLPAAVLFVELVNTIMHSAKANHFASTSLLANVTDEFVLFLYAHRYYIHNRGKWIAGEVMYTNGAGGLYCQPAAFDMPVIMRAALVLEHPDDDVLYPARGLPRAWVATGDTVSIRGAPTRWGRVDFSTFADTAFRMITAEVAFLGESVPSEVRVKLRVPAGESLGNVTVNGGPAAEVVGEEVVLRMGADVKTVTILGNY
ncbi:hypothetical protein KHU50_005798 [Colletotrichum sp. SAR 10_65]|nr:hypothetical protein KHU50_005798 [Colletotrichum sp. SAR 10_65]KAI8178504.1 hypothetical protein K4K51_004506 [Colletotrichum sp. SAR 10_75]KAI8205963.1 hypothetical protein K4K52_003574 [Colletotrichum sp. SAR 10_76]KAI8229162.1 hypothetical protein K4K53_005624 [Colletotrichum sp. SAR 10_77]